MKKIMLVDDEILIRENIRECIDWEKEGFLYCGDAPDGELALPIIEAQLPDILITDIKMPFMNGLELPLSSARNSRRSKSSFSAAMMTSSMPRRRCVWGWRTTA